MLTVKRIGIYLCTFLIVLVIVIVVVDWKWLDKSLVNSANKAGNQDDFLNKELVFVQLNHSDQGSEGASFKLFRQNTIKLLNAISIASKQGKGPKGVLLDIWFSKDTTELENLKTALKQLKDAGIPVYASYNINEDHEELVLDEIDFDEVEEKHAIDLYNGYLAGSEGKAAGSGRYHTFFYPENNVANYENDIYLSSPMRANDSVLIESLARKVAMDLTDSKSISHNSKRVGSLVPYGSLTEIEKKTYTFVPDSNSGGIFKAAQGLTPIDMAKNILVVGDAVNDLVDIGDQKIPGPYIVTWALSDLLDNNNRLKLPIENFYVIIGQVLFFSLLAVSVFALLFKYVKRLQTKPAVIAVLAFLINTIVFFLYYKLVLVFNNVVPAGHTMVATIVAIFLCWRFAHKFLVTGVAEGSQKYDVFISYSRGQGDWVYKNVYEPLTAYRKPNGDKLNIFFDKKSIGIGEAFTAKYMWAIVDTRYFIPVISEEYYTKNHCKNELDCAMKRWVEKLVSIQAIAFSFKAMPEAYNTINFVDITVNPDFMETIKANLAWE